MQLRFGIIQLGGRTPPVCRVVLSFDRGCRKVHDPACMLHFKPRVTGRTILWIGFRGVRGLSCAPSWVHVGNARPSTDWSRVAESSYCTPYRPPLCL